MSAQVSHARVPEELELTDGVVLLRRWRRRDADRLVEIWQDPELQRRFGVPTPVTGDAIDAWLSGVADRWRAGAQISLAVTVDGTLVGGCELDDLDTDEPDLGYWVAAPQRRRGYATRAGRLVVDWAVEHVPGTALLLVAEADNAASIAVADRLGFRRAAGRTVLEDDRILDVYVRAPSS